MLNLTVFCQLQADKKIDSFYCFGREKTIKIIQDKISLDAVDSLYKECQYETKILYKSNKISDSIIIVQRNEILAKDSIIVIKDNIINATEKKYKEEKKRTIKSKIKTALLSAVASASLAGNIILGTYIFIKK